jgi:hypothetical protein
MGPEKITHSINRIFQKSEKNQLALIASFIMKGKRDFNDEELKS